VSTVSEIEAALEEMPLQDAQTIAQWLQNYLDQQATSKQVAPAPVRLPDYAARRRMTFGDKVLPNMVLLGRDEERW
jgi:urease accessory protein UreF